MPESHLGKFCFAWVKGTPGTMAAVSQDGRSVSISLILQIPFIGTEIILFLILSCFISQTLAKTEMATQIPTILCGLSSMPI